MILVWGDLDGLWQHKLQALDAGFLDWQRKPFSEEVALSSVLYGRVIGRDLFFYAGRQVLSLLTMSLSDDVNHMGDRLFLLRQWMQLDMARQLAETRASRLQALWHKMRQRYRVYTKIMKKKLWLDPLTQVLNRDGVSQSLLAAVRDTEATRAAMAFLLLDLDWFKRINDSYGHGVGDVVLCHVARVIKEHVRRTDAVGRVGGDECCAVLQACDRDAAMGVAEKIRLAVESWRICVSFGVAGVPSVWAVCGSDVQSLSGPVNLAAVFQEFSLTVSVGVATFPDDFAHNVSSSRLLHVIDGATESDVLQYMADKALYQAKKEGRNRVCAYRRAIE